MRSCTDTTVVDCSMLTTWCHLNPGINRLCPQTCKRPGCWDPVLKTLLLFMIQILNVTGCNAFGICLENRKLRELPWRGWLSVSWSAPRPLSVPGSAPGPGWTFLGFSWAAWRPTSPIVVVIPTWNIWRNYRIRSSSLHFLQDFLRKKNHPRTPRLLFYRFVWLNSKNFSKLGIQKCPKKNHKNKIYLGRCSGDFSK